MTRATLDVMSTPAVPEQLRPLLAPIDSVHPAPHNPRTGHAVDAIARSLAELGWHAPVVARRANGELIIGHGRLEAAKRLLLNEVPVLLVDDDKARAITRMVADNRLTELSTWDMDLLSAAVDSYDELLDWKVDLDLDAIMDGVETLDMTSTSRDGQGVSSGLSAMKGAEKGAIMIGDVMVRVPHEVVARLIGRLEAEFTKGQAYEKTLLLIIERGLA